MASGIMIAGKWIAQRQDQDQSGRFSEIPTTFHDRVTANGFSRFKAEPQRYHLYIALGCPWAHRTAIMRALKGLNEVISISIVDPIMSDRGWKFSNAPGAIPDTVNQAQYLQEIYLKANPKYTGRVTVPVLWDKQAQTIVNNESREIMRMLDTEFNAWAIHSVDLYPRHLRQQIDRAIEALYLPINVGVYRAGFATSQVAYEEAVTKLFQHLHHWEMILGQ
jgi:glutathionyl-hydroquinone reductase